MATGCFEVDTDNLKKDINTLRQYLQIIEQAHAELRDKMTEVSGMWEGPAKDAFHLEFKNDCAELIEICTQMREVLESMDAAATEYDSCDSRIKSIIDAIQV